MPLPKLRVTREEATRVLNERIQKGVKIRDEEQSWGGTLSAGLREERLWTDYNRAWIETTLGEEWAVKYDECIPAKVPPAGLFTSEDEDKFLHRMDSRVLWLRETLQKVPLMEVERQVRGSKRQSGSPGDYEIFIVHGHDYGARDQVKLFVKSLGVTAIVLEDRPNENIDIDRKLAKYSNVDYAIVILTPDDGGNPRSNAVLELGWFRRALGEERVSILHKAGTNIPSDVGGVERTLMDDHGGWRQRLARDIKNVGIAVDPDWFSNL